MSVNINTFKLFTEALSAKVQVGNTLTMDAFNVFANQAQLIKYEEDRKIFLQTEEVSDYLKFFYKNYTGGVPVNGNLAMPSDLRHIASIRSYYVPPGELGKEVTVQEVKNADWGIISGSQLMPGTKEYPKYNEFNPVIRFLPKDIGIVMLDYFKAPVAPVWGYTVVNSRPVYSSAASTDFEWDDFSTSSVAAIFLELFGTSIKDQELIAFSKDLQKVTNTPL